VDRHREKDKKCKQKLSNWWRGKWREEGQQQTAEQSIRA